MKNIDRKSQKGFTLIELLIVVAIIAVLISILAPALQIVKRKASVAVCLTSLRKMSSGWNMYQEDNKGRIMSANDDGSVNSKEDNGKFVGWIGIPRREDGIPRTYYQTDPPVTDDDEIRGIELGKLYSYVNEPKAYRCPSNNINISIYDNTPVFVSYSIPDCLYGYANSSSGMYGLQIKKFSAVSFPETRYNFVEAFEARNWNIGHHFVLGEPWNSNNPNYPDGWAWWGPVSINHGDSSNFAFCDGHAERKIWIDPFTYEHMEKLIKQGGGSYGIQPPPDNQQTDINYMAQGWPYRNK